jgi:hypothetical protein
MSHPYAQGVVGENVCGANVSKRFVTFQYLSDSLASGTKPYKITKRVVSPPHDQKH